MNKFFYELGKKIDQKYSDTIFELDPDHKKISTKVNMFACSMTNKSYKGGKSTGVEYLTHFGKVFYLYRILGYILLIINRKKILNIWK